MRLAGDYERAEGRDLRGFLADAAARDLAEAREGEAALESEGLDAVRLMTIHRAKGLEFPVVCVADLGRQSGARRSPLLVDADAQRRACAWPRSAAATRSPRPPGSASPATEIEADAEEERRLFYVAMTRARELLILSGGTDIDEVAGAAPRRPADRLDRPRGRRRSARARASSTRSWDGRRARVAVTISTPETLPGAGAAARGRAPAPPPPPRCPPTPAFVPPQPPRGRPAPTRLSYSQLSAYGKCGYRFYLQRVLGLPRRHTSTST